MPKVTHLSETFYDDFTTITTRLKQFLPESEYRRLYRLIMRKDIVAMTTLLETLHEEKTDGVNFWQLSKLRKEAKSWHEFYRAIQNGIDWWEFFHSTVCWWLGLMVSNGGSETVARLVREHRVRLPAPPPKGLINPQ